MATPATNHTKHHGLVRAVKCKNSIVIAGSVYWYTCINIHTYIHGKRKHTLHHFTRLGSSPAQLKALTAVTCRTWTAVHSVLSRPSSSARHSVSVTVSWGERMGGKGKLTILVMCNTSHTQDRSMYDMNATCHTQSGYENLRVQGYENVCVLEVVVGSCQNKKTAVLMISSDYIYTLKEGLRIREGSTSQRGIC